MNNTQLTNTDTVYHVAYTRFLYLVLEGNLLKDYIKNTYN
jgi:hypothetical protein